MVGTSFTKELQAAGSRGQAATQGRPGDQHGDPQQHGISHQGDAVERFASEVHLAGLYTRVVASNMGKYGKICEKHELNLSLDNLLLRQTREISEWIELWVDFREEILTNNSCFYPRILGVTANCPMIQFTESSRSRMLGALPTWFLSMSLGERGYNLIQPLKTWISLIHQLPMQNHRCPIFMFFRPTWDNPDPLENTGRGQGRSLAQAVKVQAAGKRAQHEWEHQEKGLRLCDPGWKSRIRPIDSQNSELTHKNMSRTMTIFSRGLWMDLSELLRN